MKMFWGEMYSRLFSLKENFCSCVSSYVSHLPRVGETLCGSKLVICCGGKGANQAVSATRLGANTAIIGKV